jgi:hypothetical protein
VIATETLPHLERNAAGEIISSEEETQRVIGIQRNSRETTMRSKIALRLAGFAVGAAFASAPALAQYLGPPQSPGIGPNGDARYGLHNEAPYFGAPSGYSYAPGYYDYSSGGHLGGAPGGYYDYSSGGYLGGPSGYNSAAGYYGRNSTYQRRRRVYNYSQQRTVPTAPAVGAGAAKQPMGRP